MWSMFWREFEKKLKSRTCENDELHKRLQETNQKIYGKENEIFIYMREKVRFGR